MRRLLLAAALIATPAFADDPPKGGGAVQMLLAKVEGDRLVTSSSNQIQRAVVVGDKTITVTETVTTSTGRELKFLKATGVDDKEVPAADLKERLKDTSPVVFLSAPLDPTWKAKFKKGTLFVEYAAPKEEEKKGEEKKEGK